MLHELIVEVAQIGGGPVLGLLLIANIVSVAIVGNRIWFFLQHRVDADLFARQLLHPLSVGDWPKARAIARRSTASVCVVVAAGLSQAERGRHAVRSALRSARVHERTRLEGQLGVLGAVARAGLPLGMLGTVLDWIQISHLPTDMAGTDVAWMLACSAAGLMVAVPALLAFRLLNWRVRLTLRQIDTLAQLLLLQVPRRARRSMKPDPSAQQRAA
jgi:biopolymer transport protein ExbB